MAGTDADFGAEATLQGGLAPRPAPGRTQPDPRLPSDLDRSSLSQRERSLQLTRYVLLRRLGAGGMGVVYQAYDPSLDRKVAIKLLRVAPGDDPVQEAHARLLREAQALAKLSHANVVAVHDVGTYDAEALTTLRFGQGGPGATDPVPRDRSGAPLGVFLVMEYVPGVTLAQWLDQKVRGVREVLDVFLDAGRGLVAAHAVGVIHRDFKPANVLVGRNGRVCVFDFGLARAAGEVEPAGEPTAAFDPLTSAQLSAPLTQIGTVIGTPAYTAPEQRGGLAVDERADQFSFCVALYEGLYGNRPFSGENIFALEEAKALSRIDPPRRKQRPPAAIHRAILRGLSPDPAERWPSMAALLAALERSLRRGRRLALAGAALGLAALVGGTAYALAGEGDAPRLCTGAAEALAPTWGPAQRDALTAAFAATGLPYAPDATARAVALLDAHADAWIAGHTDACEAANVRGEQSHELLDRRMRCLESRRRELAALLAVMTTADADVVEHARDAIDGLPSPARCADLDALLADVEPPATAELAASVEAVRDDLAAADAELHAGHDAAGLARAEAAELRSRAIAYRPLRVEALAELADQRIASSKFDDVERLLRQTYWEALATRRDHDAFDATNLLAAHVGQTLARPEDGKLWLSTAEALFDRLGRPRAAEATLELRRGQLAEAATDLPAAIEHYRRSLALHDAPARVHADRLAGLANSLMSLGRLDEAQAAFEELDVHFRRNYGPAHPSSALSRSNLANIATLRGDFATANRLSREALTILRAAVPPRHQRLGFPLSSLGDLALQRGELTAALASFDEARAIWEHNLGPRHPRVAAMLERLSAVEFLRGDLALSEQHAKGALAIWERAQAPDPQGVVLAQLDLAQIARAHEDHVGARTRIDAALAVAEPAFGKDHLLTAYARAQRSLTLSTLGATAAADTEIAAAIASVETTYGRDSVWLGELLGARAEVHKARGRVGEAVADLERGLSLLPADSAPVQRADLEFLFAQVLWDSDRDRPRARALAESARDTFRRCEATRQLTLIETWLAAHRLPL